MPLWHPIPRSSPTLREKDIEAARRRTQESYYLPPSTHLLQNWHLLPCFDIHISSRLQDLFTDLAHTTKHHNTFFLANMHIPRLEFDDAGLPVDARADALTEIYRRAMRLCEERLQYLHDQGTLRTTVWSQWYVECTKPSNYRDEAFIAAVEATIDFLEEDYMNRKMDFVTELYALLAQQDGENAAMVLGDLGEMWAWTRVDFVGRLEGMEVEYGMVRRANHTVERDEEWREVREEASTVVVWF